MTQPPQWPYPPPAPGYGPPAPPPPDRPSRWWLLLGWVGGVVGWIRLRTHDPRAATRFLRQGITVSVLLVLASAGTTVALLLSAGSEDDPASSIGQDRDDARAAAEAVTVALSSVTAATAEADVARVLSLATGAFGQEFRNNQTTFIHTVRAADVSSVGRVDESAVESVENGRVRVLVATTSTVRNATIPAGEDRPFRMAVEMVEVDGRWLADRVEYIP